MKLLPLLFAFFTTQTFAQTYLMMIGGGPRPVAAMERFVFIAGGGKSNILVVPWASQDIRSVESIRTELLSQYQGHISIAPTYPMNEEQRVLLMKQINEASGIFFTGGDQNKLMNTITGLNLKSSLKAKFMKGTIFGGTSAGTAIMSQSMITGKGDLSVIKGEQIERSPGLGLLPPNIIVDQHFIVRSRFNRLAGVVLETQKMGIGIDEGTALLVVNNETAEVIGPTQVLVFRPIKHKKLSVEIVSNGELVRL